MEFRSAREHGVDRNLATDRTFRNGEGVENEMSFADGTLQMGKGAALLLVTLLSLGLWAAIWVAAHSLGSAVS